MEPEEYRREIMAHAAKLGFVNPRQEGSSLWFTCPPNRGMFVDYEPKSEDRRCLTNAKIALSCCMRAYNPDSMPVSRERREYRPSKNLYEPWMHVFAPDADKYPDDLEAGKWMMFVSRFWVDKVWSQIKRETKAGRLSFYAKISTAGQSTRTHILCVYVPDWSDKEKAMELRERLRALGFKRKIYFKRDSMTLMGQSGSEYGA